MSKRLPCSGRTQAPECGLPSLGRSVPVPVAGTGDRIHRWETGGGEGLTPEKGGAGRRSRARKLSLQSMENTPLCTLERTGVAKMSVDLFAEVGLPLLFWCGGGCLLCVRSWATFVGGQFDVALFGFSFEGLGRFCVFQCGISVGSFSFVLWESHLFYWANCQGACWRKPNYCVCHY